MENELTDKQKRKIYSKFKGQAKRRKKAFTLTQGELIGLVTLPCFYCGATNSNKTKVDGEYVYHVGLDRIDNKKGYSVDNVNPCCRNCNTLRGRARYATWANFINGVAKYRKDLNPIEFEGEPGLMIWYR